MKILLAAVLATVIVAPCMAADNQSEDRSSADVQTPGVTEPRTPDTLKPGADQRIRTEGRASESSPAEKKAPAMSRPNGDKDDIKK